MNHPNFLDRLMMLRCRVAVAMLVLAAVACAPRSITKTLADDTALLPDPLTPGATLDPTADRLIWLDRGDPDKTRDNPSFRLIDGKYRQAYDPMTLLNYLKLNNRRDPGTGIEIADGVVLVETIRSLTKTVQLSLFDHNRWLYIGARASKEPVRYDRYAFRAMKSYDGVWLNRVEGGLVTKIDGQYYLYGDDMQITLVKPDGFRKIRGQRDNTTHNAIGKWTFNWSSGANLVYTFGIGGTYTDSRGQSTGLKRSWNDTGSYYEVVSLSGQTMKISGVTGSDLEPAINIGQMVRRRCLGPSTAGLMLNDGSLAAACIDNESDDDPMVGLGDPVDDEHTDGVQASGDHDDTPASTDSASAESNAANSDGQQATDSGRAKR